TVLIGRNISAAATRRFISEGVRAVFDLETAAPAFIAEMLAAHAIAAARKSDGRPAPLIAPNPMLDPRIAFLAEAVEDLSIGVYVSDRDHDPVFKVWNKQMERLFQKS